MKRFLRRLFYLPPPQGMMLPWSCDFVEIRTKRFRHLSRTQVSFDTGHGDVYWATFSLQDAWMYDPVNTDRIPHQ